MEGESSLPKASENRLTDTPAVTKAGGKVRVKLGEKGAAWSEQALYGKEGDSEELPSYLKNPPKVRLMLVSCKMLKASVNCCFCFLR